MDDAETPDPILHLTVHPDPAVHVRRCHLGGTEERASERRLDLASAVSNIRALLDWGCPKGPMNDTGFARESVRSK